MINLFLDSKSYKQQSIILYAGKGNSKIYHWQRCHCETLLVLIQGNTEFLEAKLPGTNFRKIGCCRAESV